MKVLITGITGSGGSYLAEYVLANHPGVDVFGLHRWHSATTLSNIDSFKDDVFILECDLCDLSSVIRALKIAKPDRIFHLASYANVRKCFDTPLAVINNNIIGTANLLEGIRLECPEAILQMCSTSEVYGNPLEFPMTESHALRPVNPYSVSKLSQEALAYAYHKSWGLKVIITRMFAYLNPRRRDLFASAFAFQVAQVERGRLSTLYHGNLDSVRTLIDVRDAMASYWVASEKCQVGEAYNIGGKDVLSVGDFLNILISKAKKPIVCKQDPALFRPVDVTRQICDTSKFSNLTGWQPKYTLDESIEWLLDECRKEVGQ